MFNVKTAMIKDSNEDKYLAEYITNGTVQSFQDLLFMEHDWNTYIVNVLLENISRKSLILLSYICCGGIDNSNSSHRARPLHLFLLHKFLHKPH